MKMLWTICILLLLSCSQQSVTNRKSTFVSETKEGKVQGVYQIGAKKYELSNGLTLILSKNSNLPIFSIYTFYKVGSRNETKGMTGASHYLEHMMFKGAKKYGKGQFDKVIEANGGFSNAYTNYDSTVYYEKMPVEGLEQILDLEADRMQNLLLEQSDFDKEKNVVLEERKMRYENSPRGKLYLGLMNKIFKKTPYEVPVIGSIEDIKGYKRDDVYQYFKKYYAPNNAVMLIVGDIDYDKTFNLVKKYFSQMAPDPEVEKEKIKRENFSLMAQKNEENHYNGKSQNPMFALAFPGVAYGGRIGYVGDILSSVLAGSKSAFLNQKYVNGRRPALSSVSSYNYTLQYAGIFYVSGEIINGQSPQAFKKDLLKSLDQFCKVGVTDKSVQKVKNQYLLQFYGELGTNSGVANYLGLLETFTGDFRNYIKEMKEYQSITTKEVQEACFSYLKANKHYYLSIWDKNREILKL